MATITETLPPRYELTLKPSPPAPLQLSGALDQYDHFDVTPVIGREYPTVNLKEWLEAPNSDELIRDLAITSQSSTYLRTSRNMPSTNREQTVSQRGVVFFRKQEDLNNDLQKQLAQRLGELSGKPSTSKLHIHPVHNAGRKLGGNDNEVSVLSSDQDKEIYGNAFNNKSFSAKESWHTDIPFENIPSDYALLRLTQLPASGGGDTLCKPQSSIWSQTSSLQSD